MSAASPDAFDNHYCRVLVVENMAKCVSAHSPRKVIYVHRQSASLRKEIFWDITRVSGTVGIVSGSRSLAGRSNLHV